MAIVHSPASLTWPHYLGLIPGIAMPVGGFPRRKVPAALRPLFYSIFWQCRRLCASTFDGYPLVPATTIALYSSVLADALSDGADLLRRLKAAIV